MWYPPYKRHLRIAMPIFPPETYPCLNITRNLTPNQLCEFPGYTAEMLGELLRILNVTYEIIPDENYGSFNGATKKWSGILGGIANGTYDTALAMFAVTEDRLKYFEWASPLAYAKYGFLVRKQSNIWVDSTFVLVNVFSPALWMMLFTITLATVIISYGANYPLIRRTFVKDGILKAACITLLAVLGYHPLRNKHSSSLKIVLLSFGLLMLFIIPLYRCFLLSHLLTVPHRIAFKGTGELADLISQGVYRLATPTMSYSYFTEMREDNATYFEKLKTAVGQYPVIVEPDMEKLLDMAETAQVVVLSDWTEVGEQLIHRCHLTFVRDQDTIPHWGSFIFRNTSHVPDALREMIMAFNPYIQQVLQRYIKPTKECGIEERGEEPLRMHNVWIVFLLLVTGCSVAAFVLFVERYKRREIITKL